jgi:hypothetical protein
MKAPLFTLFPIGIDPPAMRGHGAVFSTPLVDQWINGSIDQSIN